MSDCGDLRFFLGIKIDYNYEAGEMKLSQKANINRLLQRFGMNDCNAERVPMEKKLQLTETGKLTRGPYRELLGSLMYLMLCTRPDLCFPVGYFGRFQQNPTTQHWEALKQVVRYIQGTRDLVLLYRRDETSPPLVGYADSDWASDEIDRVSVSGYMYKVFGCSVDWTSKKQQTVAASSTEAEYVALSLAAMEAIWLQGILEDLNEASKPTTIFEDNRGCICMAKNLETKRTKHIDVKHHFLRDHVASGILKIAPISTQDQLADIFTKPLESTRFQTLRNELGLTV